MERKPTHRITLNTPHGPIDSHDVYGGEDGISVELVKKLRTDWTILSPGDFISIEEL